MSQQINILFLDDMEKRHQAFMKSFGSGDWKIWQAWTAKEAIGLLNRMEFAQAFLDHDLSEEDIMCEPGGPSSVPTGMAVVDHIVAMPKPVPIVIVHSMNEPAAHAMVAKLEQVVRLTRWVPFHMIPYVCSAK
jgi:ActR/RegA family two-component response regulator